MIDICQFGAGRIGKIHAANIAAHPGARLRYVVDVNREAAAELARACGADAVDTDTALADAGVVAVAVASSTDSHADVAEAAARAGKAIFCEKPIDLDIGRVDACLSAFIEATAAGRTPTPGGEDGRAAQQLAEAALASYQSNKPVRL